MDRGPSVSAQGAGRYASAGRRIAVELETPAELAHALRCENASWEMVIDGQIPENVGVGESVRLSVEVKGHTPHTLRGVVLWRRLGRCRGLAPAFGVRIEESEAEPVSRLLGIAHSRFEDDVRDVLRWRSTVQQRFA